jgi:serine phosphatase RsbU (regulator of sigma subunit)
MITDVTCIVAIVDARAGTLTYATAGHPPGVIIGTAVRVLDTAGPPAGMFDRTVYTSDTRTLNPGDLTILVTDGISEALGQNGSFITAIADLVSSGGSPRQPSTLCEAVMASARAGRGPLGVDDWTDDRTVVAFQWAGSVKPLQRVQRHR